MTIYEILAILIAGGGLWISIRSNNRSKKIQNQSLRLQQKQEELTDIQLKLHKEKVEGLEQNKRQAKSADVRVSLEGDPRHARFVIRNWGFGAANNVNIKVKTIQGEGSPLVSGDYDKKLPIPRLAPGTEVKLIAALTMDTGVTFDVEWTWENEDGTTKKENSRVSL